MFCLPLRRKGRRGDPPKSWDSGIIPERSPGAAGPWQPHPEDFHWLCRAWSQDGTRESCGDPGVPGEAGTGPGSARVDGKEPGNCRWNAGEQQGKLEVNTPRGIQRLGKEFGAEPGQGQNGNVPGCAGRAPKLLEKPESGWNAGGGKSQQEKVENTPRGIHPLRKEFGTEPGVPHQARNGNMPGCAEVTGKAPELLGKLENTPSEIQLLGKGSGTEPGVPHQARNGNVPREGPAQPQPPLQAGSSEDAEGDSSGFSTAQGSVQSPGGPGADPRARLWEKLLQLGEAMEQWEGKPTAALAARLALRIAQTPTRSYPAGPGATPGAGPEPGAANGFCVGMLRVSRDAESSQEDSDSEHWEDSEDSGWEQEQDPDPAVAAVFLVRSAAGSALEEEFPALWSRSAVDCGQLEQEERLDGPPVRGPSRRPPDPDEERQMAELLREYLREGIVVEGSSASDSAPILIPKRHGRGWRLSLKCDALNAATPAAPQERPRKEQILASIHHRSHFFSVVDLSDACLAIPLARSSWHRFAFTFRGRQFQFTRLPPTFRDTSSILHRRVAAALACPQPLPGVSHYYDDILVTGRSRRQAEFRTRRVLRLIQSAGFKARREKAQLVQRQVRYLGVTLGPEGRRVCREKLREIGDACDAPGPWEPRRLLSVLKKLEAWKEFIADFWELALPLQRLAGPGKGQRVWRWGRQEQEQLRRLREALENAPALRFPRRTRPFVIRVWVHAETEGAELLQEEAGVLLPVGFSSHWLRGSAAAPPDAWCLAAVRAVRAFRLLTGSAPVVIQDPNGNYLLRGQAFATGDSLPPEPWTLLLAPEGPEPQANDVISIPAAPPLRELPDDVPGANVWFLAVQRGPWPSFSAGFAAASLEERRLLGVFGNGSEEDAELEALVELLDQHRSRSPLFLYCDSPGLTERLKGLEWGWEGAGDAWPGVLRWLWAFPGMLRLREAAREPLERERLREVRESARAALGCVGPRSTWMVWEPSRAERQEVVAQCHRHHEGLEPTLRRVREVQAWGSARQEVTRWVRSCPTCSGRNPRPDPSPSSYPDSDTDPDPDSLPYPSPGPYPHPYPDSDPDSDPLSYPDSDPDFSPHPNSYPGPTPDPDPALFPQRAEGPWSRLRLALSPGLPRSPEGFSALLLAQDELSAWIDAFPLRGRSQPEVSRALLRDVFRRFGKVESVLLEPGPAWLRLCLSQAPLREFWSRLEAAEPQEAGQALVRAARAAGPGWPEALPLLLAALRSRLVREERLGPLLCIPELPLEVRWEWTGKEPRGGNELGRLRGMRLRAGLREGVLEALRARPGTGTGSCRDWDGPDPNAECARAAHGSRFIRDWLQPGQGLAGDGSGIGTGWGRSPL